MSESETRKIRWQKDWLKIIDAECAEAGESFAEFVKESVALRIGKRKMPAAAKPGRPPKRPLKPKAKRESN